MMKAYSVILLLIVFTALLQAACLEVYSITNDADFYTYSQLKKEKMENFTTERNKNGKQIIENWSGISFKKWLIKNDYYKFESIRLESSDNYMMRFHKSELDTMTGFIALKKDGAFIDSTEIRVIFPMHRDMYWVRGIRYIYLEDFNPIPPPRQIFVWDAITQKLSLRTDIEPFSDIPGYDFDEIMEKVFYTDSGSVILVSRDGLKTRLEYPKHLKDSVLEVTDDNTLKLRSLIIPPGMWLKDIVYLQCGPYAAIRYDFLYRLHSLYQSLQWNDLKPTDNLIKVSAQKQSVPLESLYQPDSIPFTPDEWLELQ